MDLAIQLIFTPMVWRLIEQCRQAIAVSEVAVRMHVCKKAASEMASRLVADGLLEPRRARSV